MNKQDVVCIDKDYGFNKYIEYTDYFHYQQECAKNNGIVINKNDWINPASGYVCKNIKTGERFNSKQECTKQLLNNVDNNTVLYQDNETEFTPVDITSYNILPIKRDWSRISILSCMLSLIVIMITINIFIPIPNLKYIILFIILYFLFIYTFCPYNICELEPTYSLIRTNPELYFAKDRFTLQ